MVLSSLSRGNSSVELMWVEQGLSSFTHLVHFVGQDCDSSVCFYLQHGLFHFLFLFPHYNVYVCDAFAVMWTTFTRGYTFPPIVFSIGFYPNFAGKVPGWFCFSPIGHSEAGVRVYFIFWWKLHFSFLCGLTYYHRTCLLCQSKGVGSGNLEISFASSKVDVLRRKLSNHAVLQEAFLYIPSHFSVT